MHMYTKLEEKAKKILIIYATCSGNAQLVGEAIWDGISGGEYEPTLKKAELSTPSEINNYDATVLVCSTWNVGLLNDNMIPFYKEMLKLQFPQKIIEVIGLGDSEHYDIFCGAADVLEEAVAKVGAKQIMGTLRIDGPVAGKLEEYKQWGKDFILKLQTLGQI
jgi:flavodoxin I